jgi:hypothetical protein
MILDLLIIPEVSIANIPLLYRIRRPSVDMPSFVLDHHKKLG